MKATLLLLLLAPMFAQAGFVAKVISAPCDRPILGKGGSGNLVLANGEVWLLTSDHVLYHGDKAEGLCHSVRWENRDYAAELKGANFLRGLGLLRIKNPDSAMRAAAWDLKKTAAQDEFASLAGYPLKSEALLEDKRAQVMSWESTRPVLPLQEKLIEVKGHSEYGMSGGALLDSKGGFLGVISHQYLRMHLGAPSTEHSYSETAEEGDFIALIIPATDAIAWMSSALTGKGDARLDPLFQLKRTESAIFSGVRLTAQACIGLEQPIVARGGEGVGIGGEGVGIGGNEPPEKICRILVTLANGPSGPDFPFPGNRWFFSLRERLLAGASAQITGIYLDGQSRELPHLQGLFTAIRKGYTPFTSIQAPFVKKPEVEARLKKLGTELEQLANSLAGRLERTADGRELLLRVATSGRLLREAHWELLTSEELRMLGQSKAWESVLSLDFNAVVAIRSSLLRSAEELSQLSL